MGISNMYYFNITYIVTFYSFKKGNYDIKLHLFETRRPFGPDDECKNLF